MTDSETTLLLASGFASATRDDWRRVVEAALKGAPFDRLTSATYDGLAVEPLAARRAGAWPVPGRAGAAPWQIMARIDDPDPALANAAALNEIENGATGLSLIFAGSAGSHGFGLPPTEESIARVLDGIAPGKALAVELDLSHHAETVVDAALARGLAHPLAAAARARLGHDPLGAMASAGGGARPWSEAAPHFARRLSALARNGIGDRLAAADGRLVHNAGGSEAQELAFVLAVALAYLRALEAEGVSLEAARRMIFFRLAADPDQFLTIAKFRALRKLWARVETACGLAAEPIFISAETAWRMMARRDPHVNILRATIAVFAAAAGGADAITVLPFTLALGLPDEFARRLARNTQLVLLEECHLDKVADPAAGSGGMEDLTDKLCRGAWTLFQDIEAAGGAAAALASGAIQQKIAAVRIRRLAAIAQRKDALTGVSIFPHLAETEIAGERQRAPRADGDAGLGAIRLDEAFERLRDASDRALARNGARPRIFLAMLGTPSDFSSRAAFAGNFFEAGGIEAITGQSGDTAALGAAYKASQAALACLCSSDKVYEAQAPAAAGALKAAGAVHIYLAARPGEAERDLKAAGVQSFIYEGCDALATLRGAYDILGIAVD